MNVDIVHDIQQAYRKVVDSMSRPGRLSNLSEEAKKVQTEMECFHATFVLTLMLLDTEVTFHVVSDYQESITTYLNQMTYAKVTTIDQADFIFVLQDAASDQIEYAINKAKIGNLIDPHESATIIVEVDQLTLGQEFIFKGPGIEHENQVMIEKNEKMGAWIDNRAEKNKEYPLGIELIFVDREHRIVCVPRTTQIQKRVDQ